MDQHFVLTPNAFGDVLSMVCSAGQIPFAIFIALLVITYAYLVWQHMNSMIGEVLNGLGESPIKNKRKEKPTESDLAEQDDQPYEEKPKHGAWALGDDGEIVSLDDLGANIHSEAGLNE